MTLFWDLAVEYFPYLLRGALVTLQITAGALAISIVIGFVVALMRLSTKRILTWPAAVYVEIIRDTPALLQLFIIYFGLASWGVRLPALPSAIIALGVMGGAILTEVFRAGIESIDRGQIEAGKALGMNTTQVMKRIIMPQAFRVVLPPFTNFVVTLIKDTALVLTIAVPEIMYRAYSVAGITFRDMQIYILAGVIYFLICFPIARLARWFERRQPAN